MEFRERKRRHDDAHFPMGGKGKRSRMPSIKKFKGDCEHNIIVTGVEDRCQNCGKKMGTSWGKPMGKVNNESEKEDNI